MGGLPPPPHGSQPPSLSGGPPSLAGHPPSPHSGGFATRPGPPTPGSKGSFRGPSGGPFSATGGLPGSSQTGAPSPEVLAAQLESISLGPDAPGAPDATDPSLFPRPLMGDGEFAPTEQQLMAPPLVTDGVLCDPRVLRPAVAAVPNSMSLKSSWHLPLSLVLQPLAEPPQGSDIAVVDGSQPNAILRCSVCRSYVNPYNRWTNGALLCSQPAACRSCSVKHVHPLEPALHLTLAGLLSWPVFLVRVVAGGVMRACRTAACRYTMLATACAAYEGLLLTGGLQVAPH